MKLILRLCFTVFICFSMFGLAIGQNSYYPYQGQNSGGYGYSSGYDQSYPSLGQGNPYGYGSPYGYSQQSAPQGYPEQYNYDQYPGMPGYGRYGNPPVGSGSYGFSSGGAQSNDPTLRSRLTQPRSRVGSPEVRESTRIVTPSRRGSTTGPTQPTEVRRAPEAENGPLYGREIYWDGQESERQESSAVPTQIRPAQTANTRAPAAGTDKAENQIRPLSNLNQEQKSKRTRANVVRQQNKASSASPPPPASDFKWGRENSSVKEQQTVQSKSSFKWGMQGKPAMIGAEPGRSESSQGSTQVSQQSAQDSSDGGPKKFQWGKVQ
ncbi:MAG: hypothetical protein V1897_00655 [Pseudomonadota bacterium]